MKSLNMSLKNYKTILILFNQINEHFLYSLFIKDSLGNFNKYFNQFIVVSYILKLLIDLYKHILYATK